MHPAFSVLFFTTLSGTGFGVWFWLALRIALGDKPEWFDGLGWMFGLIAGAVLVATGVIASLWHLGKPARVWRAFSQWRSSWMSREGVFAIACFALAAMLFIVMWRFGSGWPTRLIAGVLAILCVAAVYSTAMIYASLKPIPAWGHPLVPATYLLFAAVGGGLLFGPFAGTTIDDPNMIGAGIVIGAMALWRIKRRYWRDIDRTPLPFDTGDAVGLPGRAVSSFERPHTESNYLTREMGFVVARKHANKLRTISIALFALIPALCALPLWLLPHGDVMVLLWVGAVSFQLGALVERWLFFAEAKHLVTLYY
jgi:sulfite dehydrogenase (quinone) subunit SoeC